MYIPLKSHITFNLVLTGEELRKISQRNRPQRNRDDRVKDLFNAAVTYIKHRNFADMAAADMNTELNSLANLDAREGN